MGGGGGEGPGGGGGGGGEDPGGLCNLILRQLKRSEWTLGIKDFILKHPVDLQHNTIQYNFIVSV